MLICRKGPWRVESDGHLSAEEFEGLAGLRAIEEDYAYEAAEDRAYLAQRVRRLKRRAWQRGYESGRRAAVYDCVAVPAATAFTARCLEQQLTEMVLSTVASLLGELPADTALPARLQRCLDASRAQQVLSVRVSSDDYEATRRSVHRLERELSVSALTVLPDAGLPPRSLVVETELGVIDGGLMPQLRALEHGICVAIGKLLDEYRYMDGASARHFEEIREALREVLGTLRSEVAR